MTDLGAKKYYGIGSRLLYFLQRFGEKSSICVHRASKNKLHTHTHTHTRGARALDIKLVSPRQTSE